jgi:hypothetical protein
MLRKHRPRGDALPDLREFAWRYLWRLYDNHRHAIFVTGQPTGLDLSPDGKMLAIANESPLVTLWDTGTGQQIGKFVHPGSEKVKSAAFVADGTRIATVAEGRLRLWVRDDLLGRAVDGPVHADRKRGRRTAAAHRCADRNQDVDTTCRRARRNREAGDPSRSQGDCSHDHQEPGLCFRCG